MPLNREGMTNELDGRIPIQKALSGLWWCNATYKAKSIMGQVSFPQEALLCQHRGRELCLESSLRGLQPLPKDPYCALAFIGEKQFRVALIGVECVEQRRSKSQIQGFPSQASPESYTQFSTPRVRMEMNKTDHVQTSSWVCCVVLSRSVTQSCLTLCDSMDCSPKGSSVREDSSGKNTGVGCHALLQEIFPTQGLNSGLLHCRWILYHLSYQGSIRV